MVREPQPDCCPNSSSNPKTIAEGEMQPSQQTDEKPFNIAAEVRSRRSRLPTSEESRLTGPWWGLAFSGGGIRSATFCFGLLRALAKNQLFHKFDILSTVSGGGYIGSTVGKMFNNEKSKEPPQPLEVEAKLARADSGVFTAWLRANGRYLIPGGAKDLTFAAASYARNLLGVHVELAFLSLLLGCLIVGFDLFVWKWADSVFNGAGGWPLSGDGRTTLAVISRWPTAWLTLPVIFWFGAVSSCAFWALPSSKEKRFEPRSIATFCVSLLLFLVLVQHVTEVVPWMPKLTESLEPPPGLVFAVAALCSAWCAGVMVSWCLMLRTSIAPEARANWLTSQLSRILAICVVVIGLGVMDYLAWSLGNAEVAKQRNLGLIIVLIAVALRAALPKVADLPKSLTPLTRNFVLSAMNLAGLGLLALVVIFWMSLVHRATSSVMFSPTATQLQFRPAFDWLLWLAVPIAILMLVSASNREFLNRSSLFGFYRARLVRSYLGAANPKRFVQAETKHDVTATDPNDDVAMRAYQPHSAGGPVHLLNVCVNQTSDPTGGLFNQDRKGLPLTVAPGGQISVDNGVWRKPAESADLSLGSWMAISGAAVAPGLGASTRPGVSAILMLAGIRLGYWWDSFKGDGETRINLGRIGKYGQFVSELRGRFEGDARRDWFLSDGGHFENTGAYALLREKCGLIVIADCGADPRYAFGDLENLVRKARIDLHAEIIFLRPKESKERPPIAFGSLNEIASPDSQACLAIARVVYEGTEDHGFIIIVKPNVCQGMPVDLVNFKAENPLFPQEPTTDQMFSEAQWESYFHLGYTLGDNIKLEQVHDMKSFVTTYFVDDDGAILVQDAAGKQSLQFSLKRLSSRIAATGAVSASISLGAITTVGLAGWQAVTAELNSHALASHIEPAAYKELADIFGKLPSANAKGGVEERHLGEMATALLRVGDAACNPRNIDAFRQSNLMSLIINETKRSCRESGALHASCKALLDDDKVSKCLQEEPRTSCIPMYWTRDYAAHNNDFSNCGKSQSSPATASVAANASPKSGAGEATNGAMQIPVTATSPTSMAKSDPTPANSQPASGVPANNDGAGSRKVCAGRTIYIQIYGPTLRDSVRSLRDPWRQLGASVPPVEDVWDTARRAGRGLPQPFSVPTVIYHDEASLPCANALLPVGANPSWDVRALSKNLTGQIGVMEVWIPAMAKAVDATIPAKAFCYQEDDRNQFPTRYGVHCHASHEACVKARGDNRKVVQTQCVGTEMQDAATITFSRGWANSWFAKQASPFDKPFPPLPPAKTDAAPR